VLSAACFSLLAQLVGSILLDYAVPSVRSPALAKVNAERRTCARPPELLVCGTSHLQFLEKPLARAVLARSFGDESPSIFNASIGAADPVLWERVLSNWSQQYDRPQMMLIELCPEMINRNGFWLDHQAVRLLHWRDFPDLVLPLCQSGKIMRLLNDRFLPLHMHRYQIRKHIGESLFAEDNSSESAPAGPIEIPDFDPLPTPLTQELQDHIRNCTKGVERSVRNFSPEGLSVDRLEDVLQDCERHGIRVLIFVAPLTSGYRAGYSPQVEAKFVSYTGKLQQRFGCRIIDWRREFVDEYFHDSNHLNEAGMQILTRRLVQEFLIPEWREITLKAR